MIYLFVDASFAVTQDLKSVSGVTISLGTGSVLARCEKQKTVSKSSTEAEIIAAADNIGYGIWLINFFDSIGVKMRLKLLQDNNGAISVLRRGVTNTGQTRHIRIKSAFIRDRIVSGDVQVEYLRTDMMQADGLTKPLTGEAFQKFAKYVLG